MKILDLVQGSPEWTAARPKYRCASEAPAMMGVSKHMSRAELLRKKATGIEEEIDAQKQALFDRGHEAEAAARAIVEEMIGEDLFPVTATDDEDYLLASFDGLTMDGMTGWEHKLWNEDLAAQVRDGTLDPMYWAQLEHQILVGGLERIIFVCSDGTRAKFAHMEYRSSSARARLIQMGWKQFDTDLAAYRPIEVIPAAVAEPVMQLPALSVQVQGQISVIDNLKVFGEKLTAFIDGIDKNPSDDQAFANAEAAIKTLQTAQEALEAAEASALAQTASIDELRRTVALYAGQARSTRLMLEKVVKARKDQIRVEIAQAAKNAFAEYVTNLNKRIGRPYMPAVPADFVGVMRGKKTIASLRDAVDTELARAKIEASSIADRIAENVKTLAGQQQYAFLFADAAQIAQKTPDDFTLLVNARIADHKAAEEKRLEAERQRIRAEEEAKARREAEAREVAERDRIRKEEAARIERETAERVRREEVEQQKQHAHGLLPPPRVAPAIAPNVVPITPRAERPTDAEIITAVAKAFSVDGDTAYQWILTMERRPLDVEPERKPRRKAKA